MQVRVLHVLPHRGGGAETYIEMLERLPDFEHRRFFLSSGRSPASALRSLPGRWPALAAQAAQADLLHSHGDVASVIALPLLRVRPAVMTCQGLHMLRRLEGARGSVFRRALGSVIASCRFVICSSQAEHDELARVARAQDRQKLRVIHNGVDPPSALSAADRAAVRDELAVSPDHVLVLFAGQLEARKAPSLALRAAIRARRAGAPVVLAIAGDGPQRRELEDLGSEGVRFLGYRRDIQRLLGAADVFVQPSEREGMSFALLEAMSHGLAIVAADSSSNPEALDDAGLLFPPRDEARFAELLARLARDDALRAQLGQRAKARASAQFSADAFLRAGAAIYLAALGRLTEPDRAGGVPPA